MILIHHPFLCLCLFVMWLYFLPLKGQNLFLCSLILSLSIWLLANITYAEARGNAYTMDSKSYLFVRTSYKNKCTKYTGFEMNTPIFLCSIINLQIIIQEMIIPHGYLLFIYLFFNSQSLHFLDCKIIE